MDLKAFIDQKTRLVEPLATACDLAWWNLATQGDETYAQEFTKHKTELRKIFSTPEDCRYLKENQHHPDPLLKRQAQILLLQYLENQIPIPMIEKMVELETEVEAAYTNFRPQVNGKTLSNNDLKNILLKSTDSPEREAAWSASKMIGEQVESNVHLLIKLRNDAAKMAGFSDYYSMRLELQELDQTRLFQILDQLDQLTKPHWDRYKPKLDQKLADSYGITPNDLKPWHYHDPFFQEAPKQELDLNPFYRDKDLVAIGNAFYNSIHLPAEDIIARSDLFEREKKNQHAFCICIDRKQDVRMLCNMRDNEYWMGTLLHELGHAVYDKYIDDNLPYFVRTVAHTSTTEAIAMLFGRINKDGVFLQEYCGVSKEEAQKIDGQARQFIAANLLVFARWILVMTNFERMMYQKPDQDYNKFWWDCVEKFQGVKRVPGRNKPDWAAKLHLACSPVYYQNYILGEMTASQLGHHLQGLKVCGQTRYFQSPKVGNWLRERLFSQGALRPWEETLVKATGEPLNPQYFAQDVAFV